MVGGHNETGIKLIPPVAFVVAIAVAWIAERVVALPTGLPAAVRQPVGWVVIVATVVFVVALFLDFRRRGTEYRVEKVPKVLVTDGAFAWSRNPGYVAMVIGTLAFTLVMDNLWVVPLAFVAAWVVQREVIVREEALLEREFGGDYRAYRARVRRWV